MKERESSKAKHKAELRSLLAAASHNQLMIQANLQSMSAKAMRYGMKLPWVGMDADQGMEKEFGNQRDFESDPKLFSMDEYQHPSAKDDADEAGDDDYTDDELNHGDDEIERADAEGSF